MQIVQLGQSDLYVPPLCLGTMTFGEQNTEAEAHTQLDRALALGVNFIDAAEMYPIPARRETQGLTERYIGSWLKRQPRDRLVLATKIAGPHRGMEWIRSPLTLEADQFARAIDTSLARLQTDYIDLYQIHWPARPVPLFGSGMPNLAKDPTAPSIQLQLEALSKAVEAGKVRYIGVSNETAWGVAEFVRVAEQYGLPRIATIQNAASLVNRTFEMGLAESCFRSQVSLLAYSPLAFGHLSGKYIDHPSAEGRVTRFPAFGQRYNKPNLQPAVAAYVTLAREHGLKPAQMAIAWLKSRWWVSSTIIGATTMAQLEENISSLDLALPEAVIDGINAIHQRYPNPAP
ncbi:MAG: aldo/keto reductase [Burkholderiales bacterium]|nr:aldo/keto reductase [Burkholderiales bacterium]